MAEGKKKQKKSPWWYKLGILVFGAVFCVSAFKKLRQICRRVPGRQRIRRKRRSGQNS